MKTLSAVLLGLLLPAVFLAQTPEEKNEKNYEVVCKTVTSGPLIPPVLSGPLTANKLPACVADDFYYSYHATPNYPAALQCAWYQRAHPRPSVGDMFYGVGVLTMLYANGQGVPRDLNLALRFACEQPWAADAEMVGRIFHLEVLRCNKMPPAKFFDLCDDITSSGLSMGACALVDQSLADRKRARSNSATATHLPAASRADFAKLQVAEKAFEDARSSGEMNLSGTARTAFMLEEEGKLKDQFLINLRRFGKGDIPAAAEDDAARLDAEMNAVRSTTPDQPSGPECDARQGRLRRHSENAALLAAIACSVAHLRRNGLPQTQ